MWYRDGVWRSLKWVRPSMMLGKSPFTLGFPLLFHFVIKETKIIKRGVRCKFHDMGDLVIQTTQLSHKSLGLFVFQVTFQKELSKFPSILLYTFDTLFEVTMFGIVVLEVVGGPPSLF